VRTAAVAALTVAVVGATCFSLQAAGLRSAPEANSVAARAATWMLRYRLATSTFRVGNRTVHGRCFYGWFEGRHDQPVRGTILVLDNGASIRLIEPKTLLAQGRYGLVPRTELDLAGCTHVLGDQIAGLAEFDGGLRLQKTLLDGQHALAIRFRHLTLLVSPKTDRPLGVSLARSTSSIRLAPITARVERALEGSA
jgi:hypothetical protein